MTQIRIARHAGACYGVERALRMVHECAEGDAPVHTLGPLIHNPVVVDRLAREGVTVVDQPAHAAPGDVLVIRSHGVPPQVVDEAVASGLRVVDATCPHVKKAHDGAAELAALGYQVVVVGEAGHPEVEGIKARAGGRPVVACGKADLDGVRLSKRVGVVVQTTQSPDRLAEVVSALAPRVVDLRVLNTICAATSQRQQAAAELAAEADTMIVVGGKNSGNTRRLAEACRALCPATHHIETAGELDPSWFDGAGVVGVTAGASTPSDQIEEVVTAIQRMAGDRRPGGSDGS